jgi:hypothetical protein
VLSSGALADDCKPIKDALAKQAITPAGGKMKKIEWDVHGQCRMTVGVFRNYVGGQSYNPTPEVSTFPNDASCTLIGEATLRGEVVQHYAASGDGATHRTFSEFWISPATGLLLERYQKSSDSEVTLEYDYNADFPL